MFSLESPRGNSNEHTQYTIFNIKKKITAIYSKSKSSAKGFFSMGPNNKFETAVLNEPSVFQPLKFYCIYCNWKSDIIKIISHWPASGFTAAEKAFFGCKVHVLHTERLMLKCTLEWG